MKWEKKEFRDFREPQQNALLFCLARKLIMTCLGVCLLANLSSIQLSAINYFAVLVWAAANRNQSWSVQSMQEEKEMQSTLGVYCGEEWMRKARRRRRRREKGEGRSGQRGRSGEKRREAGKREVVVDM